MADIDLRALTGDDFVLHFGGRPNEVNANTFANSVLALSEALREINSQVNPDFAIEIVVDAIGKGSFRTRLKTTHTKITNLFKSSVHPILVGVLSALIYDKTLAPQTQVIVQDDSYIVQRGHDRIILPRAIYEAKQKLKNPEEVDRHVARAFEALEDDPSVSEFGITPNIHDPTPLVIIPRNEFALVSHEILPKEDANHRIIKQDAQLVVLRAVLERSERKWQFVWNGIRISAPIKDPTFFDKLAKHEYEFGQGDILVAVLAIYQIKDEIIGAYLNEKYEVVEVKGRIAAAKQQNLLP